MKTWQAIILSIASIFGGAFATKIKDPVIQNATLGSLAIVMGAAAKINSESDQQGNKLPPIVK